MRFNFRFPYNFAPTPEQLEVLRRHVRNPEDLKLDDDGKLPSWHQYAGNVFAIMEECPGLELTVETGELGVSAIESIHDRLTAIEKNLTAPRQPSSTFNERIAVHVAGLGTLLIDEVVVHVDLCTESLQEELDKGWRILAVCVQPDQRRPDYVLGRTKVAT